MKIVHKNVAIKAETCSWHHACTFGMKIFEPPTKASMLPQKCAHANNTHDFKVYTC